MSVGVNRIAQMKFSIRTITNARYLRTNNSFDIKAVDKMNKKKKIIKWLCAYLKAYKPQRNINRK